MSTFDKTEPELNISLEGIGERIKERRLALNMSQADLANRIQLAPDSRTQISKWENPKNKAHPTIEQIPLLCKALKCDTGYLFGEHEAETEIKQIIMDNTGLNSKAVDFLMDNTKKGDFPHIKIYSEPWEQLTIGQRNIAFINFILTMPNWRYLCILYHRYLHRIKIFKNRQDEFRKYKEEHKNIKPNATKEEYYEHLQREMNKTEFEFLLNLSNSIRELQNKRGDR